MTQITYDRYSLILNGKRTFIRSGAMHYFRLPSYELWKDRLYKLKVAGYNCVDLYFNWGYHSPADGVYDFSGIRDIHALLTLAKELGLWVIARPGPYINAEVSGGGFPMWLLAKKELPLRNRRDGHMVWSDEYMAYVRQWWGEILPIVNQFDNVLMVQIENEYSTLEVEPDYMQALYKMARDLGVTVPLSHNDLFIAGLYEDIVDLYAFDNYSVTQFETDWKKMTGIFSVLENIENNLRPFCQNRPLIAAELQAGWFGMWKGHSYDNITGILGREHINLSTKTLLSQGLTVFNHYKAIGGTNWEHIGSTETYTSYDFGAPISETGINTIRLYEAKSLNYLLDSFDLSATDRVTDQTQWPFQVSNQEHLLAVRKVIDNNSSAANTHWLFLRNMSGDTIQTILQTDHVASLTHPVPEHPALSIAVSPHAFVMLPYRVKLACGFELVMTNAQPLFQNDRYLIVHGEHPVNLTLAAEQAIHPTENPAPIGSSMTCKVISPTQRQISHPALSADGIASIELSDGKQSLTVIALGDDWVDHFWQDKHLLGDDLLLGPDAILSDSAYAMSDVDRGRYILKADGTIELEIPPPTHPAIQCQPVLPELNTWQLFDATPECFRAEDFHVISPKALDLDANGQYEGSAWYCVRVGKARPKSIQVDITHVWAIYVNNQLLQHGHSLIVIPDDKTDALVDLPIPETLWHDDNNTILIFVDSLGHPKGFHDDQQEAQGLRRLLLDQIPFDQTDFEIAFSGCLSHEKVPRQLPSIQGEERFPLIYAETTFELPDCSLWEAPLGLQLKNMRCERANLYLNDTLFGRYWDDCKAQTSFYMPPSILHTEPGKENRLGILFMDFDTKATASEWQKRLEKESIVSLCYYEAIPKFPL